MKCVFIEKKKGVNIALSECCPSAFTSTILSAIQSSPVIHLYHLYNLDPLKPVLRDVIAVPVGLPMLAFIKPSLGCLTE